MTDPNIKPEPFDIDHDCDGLSLRHDADGRLTMRDGDRLWTSVDQGRTWKAVETDCDGLYADPAMRLDDTPGPDGTGAKSGIMIEVPAEGWPSGWGHMNDLRLYRTRPLVTGAYPLHLPNTEAGRRAAWAMVR